MLRRNLPGLLAVLAAGPALTGCAGRGEPAEAVPVARSATRAESAEYVIGPGDNLQVFVHRAPELSADNVPVRPDGRLSLPLVSDIQAAGLTPTQLSRNIEGRLKQFVLEPTVSVIVRSFVGMPARQIRVVGEAVQPMAIPYREGMTVLDVIIATRGLTRYAAGNRAEIVRRENEGVPPKVIRVRLSDLLRDGDVSQDIPMQPGDTLVVPQGWF